MHDELSAAEIGRAPAGGLSDGDIVESVANVTLNIFENYMSHVARVLIDFRKANVGRRPLREANQMANIEKYDDLIIGSGIAGKFAAWTRDSRRRTVIVERGLLGGACPNVACLPSKNLIWSAKVISWPGAAWSSGSRLIP